MLRILLDAPSPRIQVRKADLSIGVAKMCGALTQLEPLTEISLEIPMLRLELAEQDHGRCMALINRLLQPLDRLVDIRRHKATIEVGNTQVCQRLSQPLICRQAQPFESLLDITGDASAV